MQLHCIQVLAQKLPKDGPVQAVEEWRAQHKGLRIHDITIVFRSEKAYFFIKYSLPS